MADVTVRYWAAAKAAVGTAEERLPASSLAVLKSRLAQRHGPEAARILGLCSFLADGLLVHDESAPIPPGTVVEALPPFAGG